MTRSGRPPWRMPRLALALGVLLVAARAAEAGPVALVKSGALGPYDAVTVAFRAAWHDSVLTASLEGQDPARLAARLQDAHPEVVVAVGIKAAEFVRDQLPRIPMIFCMVQNPERHELVGSRITGISTDIPPRLELQALHDAAPDVVRVGLLHGAAGDAAFARAARLAAAALGLTLVERSIRDPAALPAEARDLAAHVDALWMPADPAVATPEAFRFLLDLSLQTRKPLLVFSEALVRAGAFIAVSPDYGWVGAQAAEAVRRIRSGERAGDIPVVPLGRTRVVLNPAAARALGRDPRVSAVRGVQVLP